MAVNLVPMDAPAPGETWDPGAWGGSGSSGPDSSWKGSIDNPSGGTPYKMGPEGKGEPYKRGPEGPSAVRPMPDQFYKVNPVTYRPASWGTMGVIGGKNIYGAGPQRYAGMAGSTTGFVDPTRHSQTSDPTTIREIISANRTAAQPYTISQETMRENYGPKTTNSGRVVPSGGTVASPAVSVPRTGPIYAPAGGGYSKPTLPLVQTPIAPYRSTGRGN